MARYNQLSSYKTTVSSDGDATRVTYHSTVIVEWTKDEITLRTGGWRGVTTKRKMNQAAWQFGLGYGVHQRKHEWYVSLWCAKTSEWICERPFDDSTFTLNRHDMVLLCARHASKAA